MTLQFRPPGRGESREARNCVSAGRKRQGTDSLQQMAFRRWSATNDAMRKPIAVFHPSV